MKRTGKLWLALLLTVLAAALLAAGMTAAAETPAVVDSGSAGPNAAYTLYDNGVLSFESSGNGEITKRFTKEIYPFYDRYDTVVVGDGITEVGYAVFDGAKNLKHLDLGNSLH